MHVLHERWGWVDIIGLPFGVLKHGWGIFNCHEYQDQKVGLLDLFIVSLPTLVNLILGERIMLFL